MLRMLQKTQVVRLIVLIVEDVQKRYTSTIISSSLTCLSCSTALQARRRKCTGDQSNFERINRCSKERIPFKQWELIQPLFQRTSRDSVQRC